MRPLVLALALVAPALAVPPGAVADPHPLVQPYVVAVGDGTASGLLARPAGAPVALVVIARGYGHAAASHEGHLQRLAQQGAIAVAMDYRGAGFPLRAGADDTIAATRDLLAGPAAEVDLVVLYSVSMGTAVAGMVLAEMPGVFHHLVSNEGLSMLHETWAGAGALAPVSAFARQAKEEIEAETGGTPATAAAAYAARSASLLAPSFVGLQGAILAHGVNDGLVPYDQGRELHAALVAVGVPVDFHTVLRGPGAPGTTLTGYPGLPDGGLSGHGSESNDGHAMTAVSFALLDQVVFHGLRAEGREVVVDAGLEPLG